MVSPGAGVSAVWAGSFYESVRQESVAIWAVKLLGFLGEDVAVLVDFQQKVSHELLVHRVFCAGVVAEGYAPSAEEIHHSCMVPVCQLFWGDFQSYGFYLDGCPMLV